MFQHIHQVKGLRFGFITYTSTKCVVSPLKAISSGDCVLYRLRGHHLINALLILFCQLCELAGLFLLQRLQDGFVVTLGRDLQLMVPQSFVLLILHLTRILELLFDLHFQCL